MTLFVRTGALGDFVLTIPVLRALLCDGPVDVVCPERYAPLLPRGAVRVDDAWLWVGEPRPYAQAWCFSATAAACLRACGVADVRCVASRPPPGMHATAHYADGLGPIDLRPRVEARPDPAVPGRPVVIAPGSGGVEKRWPIARWLEVGRALGVPTVWVAGPVEEGERGWPIGTLRPGIPGLVGLAAACGAWLGPDSGPSHLAAAAGAPVATIFGPTDPACWAPVGATVCAWDTSPAQLAEWARAARDERLVADRRGGTG